MRFDRLERATRTGVLVGQHRSRSDHRPLYKIRALDVTGLPGRKLCRRATAAWRRARVQGTTGPRNVPYSRPFAQVALRARRRRDGGRGLPPRDRRRVHDGRRLQPERNALVRRHRSRAGTARSRAATRRRARRGRLHPLLPGAVPDEVRATRPMTPTRPRPAARPTRSASTKGCARRCRPSCATARRPAPAATTAAAATSAGWRERAAAWRSRRTRTRIVHFCAPAAS